jgi:hypothetical protein
LKAIFGILTIMENPNLFVLIFIGVILLIVFIFSYPQIVKNDSVFFLEAKDLNTKYINQKIEKVYRTSQHYTYKRTYLNSSVRNIAKAFIEINILFLEQQIRIVNFNLAHMKTYQEAWLDLRKRQKQQKVVDRDGKKRSFLFKWVESFWLPFSIIKPVTSFALLSSATYTSEQGRVSLRHSFTFSYEDIQRLLIEVKEEVAFQASRVGQMKQERGRLTKGLRYDVLNRDKFQCVICGHDQSDGVKLHIDHIFPVAKGGKTELDNLRVLCDACNLGKKDKVEHR